MRAREYFQEYVLPTYRDFQEKPDDVRLAHLTALTIYHTLDFIRNDRGWSKGKLANKQTQFAKKCFGFGLAKDMTNGFKHAKIRDVKEFDPSDIKLLSKQDVFHLERDEEGTLRKYRSVKPMLYMELGGHKSYVSVSLYTAMFFLDQKFCLGGLLGIDLPLQLTYSSTNAN